MDRYDFMSMVDDLFKECNSTEELANYKSLGRNT
jgi:hypothetical protein